MPIQVTCHSCGNTLRAPDELAGRKAKCAVCSGIVVVHEISIPEAILVAKPKPKPKPQLPPEEDEPVWAIPLEPEPVNAEALSVEEEPAWVEEISDSDKKQDRPKKKRKKRR
jgi:hypothetical protein